MDPAKLKVVELRAELQARGLDTKGNKPVLVKRLKEALEAELNTDLPDTSIADTSTEDCGSQDDDCMLQEPVAKEVDASGDAKLETELPCVETSEPQEVQKEVDEQLPDTLDKVEPTPSIPQIESTTEPDQQVQEEPMVTEPAKEEVETVKESESTEVSVPEEKSTEVEEKEKEQEEESKPTDEQVESTTEKVEQNGDNTNGEAEEETCEPKAKKSRWGNETEAVPQENVESTPVTTETESKEQKEEQQQRSDKRKHSSPSPERNQRQRSKSPIREDEPVVDANKVQLSWYDSDLHLQIDKTNFLSAKPLNDGLFAYIWSGARLTHGVKTGKACYEIKITEELKFEDILSSSDRRDNRRDRRDSRRDDRERSRTKSENGSEKTHKSDSKSTEEKKTTDNAAKEDTSNQESQDSKMETDQPIPAEKPDESNEEKSQENSSTTEVEDKSDDKQEKNEEKSQDEDKSADGDKSTSESKPAEKQEKVETVKVPSHLIRIGWSHMKTSLQLGEEKLSYGLESSGKFYSDKTIIETESSFKAGDVIRAFVDIEKRELAFAVNGTIAFTHEFELNEDDLENFALFPHVLTRNLAYELNVGEKEGPMSSAPEGYEDFVFVSQIDERVNGKSKDAEKREDCEVIIMCGLPGAGKTHWVKEYLKTTDKDYNIIGSSFLIERMTIDCKPIHSNISSDRMSFFWNKLQKSISRLCDIAPMRRRDFILDQTNVFPTAIRRKLRSFLGFKRHAVIVVNEDEEQEKRMKQQDPETGKDMSMSALLEMKANMALPKVGDNLEQATYVSLPEDKAMEQVQKYNKQGRDGGFGNISHHRRDYRDDRNNRWQQRGSGGGGGGGSRREYHHRSNRDRPYSNNRYERNYRQGSGGGGGNNWRPSGGSSGGGGGWISRNDRRDNRGPRDWRNNRSGGMSDRSQPRGGGNRDHRTQSSSNSSGSYNRNRSQSGGGGGGGRWGSSSGGWNSQSGGGSWSGSQGQDWNSGWNQSQGSWNQNQWKYGGGYNQGGYSQYPQNWNSGYYGGGSNYSQDWSGSNSGHGQSQSSVSTTSATTNTTNANSSQYSSSSSSMMPSQQQQAAWAQYAQQYTQGTTSNSGSQK